MLFYLFCFQKRVFDLYIFTHSYLNLFNFYLKLGINELFQTIKTTLNKSIYIHVHKKVKSFMSLKTFIQKIYSKER